MSDIKNPLNQVHRAADGRFYVLWRGVLLNGSDGRMCTFDTEGEAQTCLARCEAADRATGSNPAPRGFQNQGYPGPRRPWRLA